MFKDGCFVRPASTLTSILRFHGMDIVKEALGFKMKQTKLNPLSVYFNARLSPLDRIFQPQLPGFGPLFTPNPT